MVLVVGSEKWDTAGFICQPCQAYIVALPQAIVQVLQEYTEIGTGALHGVEIQGQTAAIGMHCRDKFTPGARAGHTACLAG